MKFGDSGICKRKVSYIKYLSSVTLILLLGIEGDKVMITHNLRHSSGRVMVSARKSSGGIRPHVKHQPWIVCGGPKHMMKNPAPFSELLLPCHRIIRPTAVTVRVIIQRRIKVPGAVEPSFESG